MPRYPRFGLYIAPLWSLSAALLLPATSLAQTGCGVPPGAFQYSTNFLQAEARLLKLVSVNGYKVGGTIPEVDLPFRGSVDTSSSVDVNDALTVQQATQYVQAEHSQHEAQLVAECGYRACTLAGGTTPAAQSALALLAMICKNALPSNITNTPLVVAPAIVVVAFTNTRPVTRQLDLFNTSDGAITVIPSVTSNEGSVPDVALQGVGKAITVPAKSSRRVVMRITKPSSAASATSSVTFQATGNPGLSASATVRAYANRLALQLALLPDAVIAPGPLYPHAAMANDRNPPFPTFTATQPGPYEFPIAQRGPQNCDTAGTDACGKAEYSGHLEGLLGGSNVAAVRMHVDATVGGQCGNSASNGKGGAGGVMPEWSAGLGLPGLPRRHTWNVIITTDIAYISQNEGKCTIAIDADTRPVTETGTTKTQFTVAPGFHTFTFRCTQRENPYIGCYQGEPGKAHHVQQHFDVTLRAERSAD